MTTNSVPTIAGRKQMRAFWVEKGLTKEQAALVERRQYAAARTNDRDAWTSASVQAFDLIWRSQTGALTTSQKLVRAVKSLGVPRKVAVEVAREAREAQRRGVRGAAGVAWLGKTMAKVRKAAAAQKVMVSA